MRVTALAVYLVTSCEQSNPTVQVSPDNQLALRSMLAVGQASQDMLPEHAPLYCVLLPASGLGAQDLALEGLTALADEEAEPETQTETRTENGIETPGVQHWTALEDLPSPPELDFARPVVVLTDELGPRSYEWSLLAAGGARQLEREEPLQNGLRVVVLRSATGAHIPITASLDNYLGLRASSEHRFHESDGAGRSWLDLEASSGTRSDVGQVGQAQRFEIIYEAGPLGIATEGGLFLQASPFWNWSSPQNRNPNAAGYTRVQAVDSDLELEVQTIDRGLLMVRMASRAMQSGERIRIIYGAGAAGVTTDDYAEKGERIWIAVDGNGDGYRKVLPDSPKVQILPLKPARLLVHVPSVVRPTGTVKVQLALTDYGLNAVNFGLNESGLSGRFILTAPDGQETSVKANASGLATASMLLPTPAIGFHRVNARFETDSSGGSLARPLTLEAQSNPFQVATDAPLVFWGDLHGHTNYSDGTGLPEDYFLYARDVANLDVVALTDHDHWGLMPMSKNPWMWTENQSLVQRFHEPNKFVTILGYEWTSWIYGHRHVLYFDGQGEVLSSVDSRFDTPAELWAALPRSAITIPHHTAGLPIPTDWSIAPDPLLEPVVEVSSVHGVSESSDASIASMSVPRARPGHFVRDALERGYQLGFIASSDSHDGHPGTSGLAPHYRNGGLVAFICDQLDRESLQQALRARRVYATNGARILLRFAVGSPPMGSLISVGSVGESVEGFVSVTGTAPIESIDVIQSGQVFGTPVSQAESTDEIPSAAMRFSIEDPQAGDFVYVRVLQQDGGVAWSSPVFFVD